MVPELDMDDRPVLGMVSECERALDVVRQLGMVWAHRLVLAHVLGMERDDQHERARVEARELGWVEQRFERYCV